MYTQNVFLLSRYLCRDFIVKVISKLKIIIPYLLVMAFILTAPDYSFMRSFFTNPEEHVHNLDEHRSLEEMDYAYEVVELRTAKSKTFKKLNDSYETVFHSDNIHYFDDGQFKEIDNNVVKRGDKFYNRSNQYHIELSESLNSDYSKISYNGHVLEWKFNSFNNSPGYSENNRVRYNNVFANADLEYTVLNNKVKENIILNEYIENFTFAYTLRTGLNMKREGKYIQFFDDDNVQIFTINDYFMYDVNNQLSYDIETSISKIGNDEYLITATPSQEYLQKAAYPVIIDPEIKVHDSSGNGWIEYKLFDEDGMHYMDPDDRYLLHGTRRVCTICGGDGIYTVYDKCLDCNGRGFTVGPDMELIPCPFCSGGKIPRECVCQNCIGIIDPTTLFIKINIFDSQAMSAIRNFNILYANIIIPVENSNCQNGECIVNARNLSVNDWNRTNLTGYSSSDEIISSIKFNKSSTFAHKFDFYDYLYDNLDNLGTDFSLYFELTIEGGQNSYVEYYNTGHSSVQFIIGYSKEAGLYNHYTYEEIPSSNSSKSYIAHNSGNLTTVFNDYNDQKQISLNHIFNYNRYNILGNYGYGFNLNYNESIIEIPQGLILKKGDGSEVEFSLLSGSNNNYIAKDGSGDRITYSGIEDQIYILETKNKLYKIYDNLRLEMIFLSANDFHHYVANDEILNAIELTYDASNRISIIKHTSTDYENGEKHTFISTQINFTYASNFLTETRIKKADENMSLQNAYKIVYEYSSGKLSRIKKYIYKNANFDLFETCNFQYNDIDKILTIKDDVTSGVKFVFDSANRVNKASIVVDGVTEDKSHYLDFTYDNKGRSLTISDYEGFSTKYTFDSYHHTVSVTDSEGNTTFTEYEDIFYENGQIVANPNYDMNHKIISSSAPFKNAINLVNNHSFELGDTPLYWTGNNQYIVRNSLFGDKALRIKNSSANGIVSEQQISVKGGITYNVVGYIKNPISTGDGAYIGVYHTNPSYLTIYSPSGEIVETDNYVRYSFSFISSVTTTVKLQLWNKSIGDAYFDHIQVNEVSVNTRYNYLQNASFEYTSGWNSLSTADFIYNSTTNGLFDPVVMGDKCVRIRNRTLYQEVNVSGNAGDQFVFGGSAFLDNVNANGTVRLKIYNQDSTIDIFEFSFKDQDAQYLMKKAVAQKNYKKMRFEVQSTSPYDFIYLDNLAVYKEPYGITYEYYDDGKIKKAFNEITGSSKEYEYNENGNVEKIIEDNVVMDYYYQENSDSIDRIICNNITQKYKRDTDGNVELSVIIADDTYQSSTKTITSPFETVTIDEYDRMTINTYNYLTGLLEEKKCRDVYNEEILTSYEYNNFGDVTSITRDTKTIEYTYEDRRIKTISMDGMMYEFSYNAYGDIDTIKINNVIVLDNKYVDEGSNNFYTGQIEEIVYGGSDGYKVQYTYDEKRRIKEVFVNDVATTEYVYDLYDNIAILIDKKTHTTYNYNYDNQNRLISVNSSDGNNISYTYDEDNYISSNTNINGTTDYEYYLEDETLGINANKKIKKENFGDFYKSYDYVSGFHKIDKISIGIESGAAICTDYIYETFQKTVDGTLRNYETNRVKRIKYSRVSNGHSTNLMTLIYSYDGFGNICCITRQEGVYITEEEFQYDHFNQLVEYRQYDYNNGYWTIYSYFYDSRGNIDHIVIEDYDDQGHKSETTIEYSYKQTGWIDQLISVTIGNTTYYIDDYDSLGNPHIYCGYDVTYDQRMITKLEKDSNVYQYTYNADGIRTSKNINNTRTDYVLEGNRIIREIRGNDELRYFYDVNGEIVAFTYNGTYYSYLKNLQNDIIAIADANGNIVGHYYYDAFGNVVCSGSTILQINPFRFKSYYYDAETSLYYCNSRYYNPEWGRWLNADDVSYLDPSSVNGLNLYAYCANNPVMNVDPNGTFVSTILGGIFGGFIGGISAVARGDNFWEGAAHGAAVGAAVGLIVDIAVATGGAGGLAIAAVGGFAVGTVGDAAGQMIFEDKAFSEINWGHAFAVGGLTALTSVASFGFGSVVNSAIGKSPTGSLFTQLTKSLSSIYTPAGSWAFQGLTGFAISAFSLIQL